MKNGRTHLAHKAEHAIDLETGAIVGGTVQGADQGDTTTIQETLPEAAEQLEAVAEVTKRAVAVIKEVVADKGYRSRETVHDLETLEIRTYISEPDRGPQSWSIVAHIADCRALHQRASRSPCSQCEFVHPCRLYSSRPSTLNHCAMLRSS